MLAPSKCTSQIAASRLVDLPALVVHRTCYSKHCDAANQHQCARQAAPQQPWRRRRTGRPAQVVRAAQTLTTTTLQDTADSAVDATPAPSFYYDGIVFDMDGTLTEAHIDFADMRERVGIPSGDLFTVMEAWTNPQQIARAMSIILDIEADAAQRASVKDGLFELLQLLRDNQVRVALVTRNTRASVQAFLDLIGPEWASTFSIILTREFSYVKPDTRLLLHVATEWGVDPSRLLMVGDSLEDVEVGNAAGTATCLVAGGGNEKPGSAPATPPPGAVPTFAVTGLRQLAQQLAAASARAVAMRTRASELWALEQTLLHSPDGDDVLPDGTITAGTSSSMRMMTPQALAAVGACAELGCELLGASPAAGISTELPLHITLTDSFDSSASGGSLMGTLSEDGSDVVSEVVSASSGSDADDALGLDGVGRPLAGSVRLGWPARLAAGEHLGSEGAPPPGLSFLDWLVEHGALKPGACSFPRMGAAAGGLATCPPAQQGDRVLHVCCGQGALTKMLASQGMRVVGVDVDVSAAQRRGLQAVAFPTSSASSPHPLTQHSLAGARSLDPSQPQFDVVLLCCEGTDGAASGAGVVPDSWWSSEALAEMQALLGPDGCLCAQVSLVPRRHANGRRKSINPAAIINQVHNSGMTVVAWQLVRPSHTSAPSKHSPGGSKATEATQLRLVARRHTSN